MKYLLIMHVNPVVLDSLTEEQRQAVMEGHGAFMETIRGSGRSMPTAVQPATTGCTRCGATSWNSQVTRLLPAPPIARRRA